VKKKTNFQNYIYYLSKMRSPQGVETGNYPWNTSNKFSNIQFVFTVLTIFEKFVKKAKAST